MLGFLFRTLTADPHRGAALFDLVTAQAREPHWYIEGNMPDTLDGRFAMLATITALVLVRLEVSGDDEDLVGVALTERFIQVMESEHRELGIGDPALGKKVRRLVGSLARRTDVWRRAVTDKGDWNEAARQSLYKKGVSKDALRHSAERLEALWALLERTRVEALEEGKVQ